MKKFILRCALFFVIITTIILGLLVLQYMMANQFKWKIPENKTTLFMGASHITLGIDDRHLEDAMNLSMRSERYPYTFLKLQKLLADNNKIERIVLECAPTDLSPGADYKIFDTKNEMIKYIPLYYPFFGEKEWILFKNCKWDVLDILFSHFYSNWALSSQKNFTKYGGFDYTDKVFNSNEIENNITINNDSIYGNKVNCFYLKKIIEICRSNDIELILLYCPMYKPELYYDQEYFYHTLKMNFGDIEFWDYSHLEIPDKYRYDAHHLNGEGAKYFTKILAEKMGLTYKQ